MAFFTCVCVCVRADGRLTKGIVLCPVVFSQLLGWLAEKLPTCKKLPAELQECIPYLFACMEDRNADVRKKAQDALLPFMIHTGYEAMLRHAGKLKVNSVAFNLAFKWRRVLGNFL